MTSLIAQEASVWPSFWGAVLGGVLAGLGALFAISFDRTLARSEERRRSIGEAMATMVACGYGNAALLERTRSMRAATTSTAYADRTAVAISHAAVLQRSMAAHLRLRQLKADTRVQIAADSVAADLKLGSLVIAKGEVVDSQQMADVWESLNDLTLLVEED